MYVSKVKKAGIWLILHVRKLIRFSRKIFKICVVEQFQSA